MAGPEERVGQQLGNYRLLRLLGKGAFAEVYLGEHVHLGTQAAIKVLYAKVDQDGIEAFRAEARTIASLEHPSIVRVLDFGVEGNTPFLVMNYAPGGTLRMRYSRGTRLPLGAIVSYVQQISSALQYAHERRLVHRDIKPENLLVGRNNEVLLSDFGIALVAQSSRYQHPQDVAGTISYMAPEQIQSYPRPASDQYSLGIVVYEWLGGEVPFKGTFTDVAVKHALMQPPSLLGKIPTLSPYVERVVFTALAKDPQQRFPTVLAFASALKQAYEAPQQPSQSFPTFPMSDTSQYQSWQSTFVKPAPGYSMQPTILNTLSATPISNPSTPIPNSSIPQATLIPNSPTPIPSPYTSPITPIPNSSIPQATLIPNPSTPIPSSTPPVYTSTPTPEGIPPSLNTWKREAPKSFIRSTRFRVVLIAVVCAVIIAGFVSSFVRSASPPHPAMLVVDHSVVDFGKIEKGAMTTLAVGLSNTGEQALSCTASVGKVPWLQVQTGSTTIGPGAKELDNLTINTASLPLGPSSALLIISSNGGNVQVQVKVEVIHSGQKAAILSVSTRSLQFGTVTTASQITPQSVVVSNVGILGLTWKADVGADKWVVLDRSSGTIQPGGLPQTINVKVQAAGLATGSYSDMVTITSNGGKQSVQVSMMVNSSATPQPSPTQSSASPSRSATPTSTPQSAQMSLNATSLNFGSMSAGQSQSMPLVVRNSGGKALTWQATTGGTSWVTLDTSNGTIQPALSQTINVTVNTKGFSPGPKSATLTINSNGGNQSVAITLTVTATPLWVASTTSSPGNSIYSSAAVASGVVYVGSANHTLYAFNASTGATLWAYTTGGPIYSSPAVVNGVVYFGSDDFKLYALNASTGTLLWSYPTGNHVRSSPTIVNGVVYFGSEDNKLYAVNASSGTLLWSYTTGGIVHSTPAVVNGVIYFGSYDDKLYAVNASSGSLLWSYPTGNYIKASATVVNGVVYIGSEDNNLYALNASTGAVLWTASTGGAIEGSSTVVNGVIYSGSDDDKLYAWNASSGAQLWTVTTGSVIHSAPVISNGVVYIGSNDYKLYAVNASSGAVLWTYTTGSYVGATPTVVNGVVYIGSGDGKLYAFTAS